MDTTIKVDSAVRDRLAVLAAERGTSLRELVSELAASVHTREELDASRSEALAYVRTHLCPDLSDADLDAGEQFWRALETPGGGRPDRTTGDAAAS